MDVICRRQKNQKWRQITSKCEVILAWSISFLSKLTKKMKLSNKILTNRRKILNGLKD